MRTRVVIIGALLVLAGCGVEPQAQPEPLVVQAPPAAEPSGEPGPDGPLVTVFFVRGTELAPVARPAAGSDATAAMDQLTTGPTRPEVLSGLRTALAPQSLAVDEGLPGGLTSVSVTRDFTAVTGANQLLAVAQVVWTLTDLPETTEVRFLADGVPVEVPTDEGLTDQPVERDDYQSVAPPASMSPAGPAAPPTGNGTPTATD
jgi:hypothetical protein